MTINSPQGLRGTGEPTSGRNHSIGASNRTELEVRQLYFSYADTEILHGINLTVPAGVSVAVVGASGSGKTTLLHCLSGIHAPASGQVLFSGADLGSLDEDGRRRVRREHFGFVLQFGRLIPELSALENVSLPLRIVGVSRGEAEDRAAALLDQVGLSARKDLSAGKLSGGESQRAAVARALVHGPSVVFADEPTGALDSKNSEVVMDLLLAGADASKQRPSIVVVTHDDDVAAKADRIVRMRDGVVCEA